MTGSRESASNKRILVCGLNWVGDLIMSFPALQALRAAHPKVHIALLVKPGMRVLAAMHPVPDEVLVLESGLMGIGRTVRRLKQGRFDTAYILPHSFRSALGPWLARIPDRIGMPGHQRDFMLTSRRPPPAGTEYVHQAWEYINLMVPEALQNDLPAIQVRLSAEDQRAAFEQLPDQEAPWVGLIPGAARGPSKQWPMEYFVRLGERVKAECSARLVLFGAGGDRPLCDQIQDALGADTVNLAGSTTLGEWAALMARCRVVCCNDSGGMHLAGAVGTPIVAMFGITDPSKTGPLSPSATVLQKSTIRNRNVPRDSQEAREALASISPDEVFQAVKAQLQALDASDG